MVKGIAMVDEVTLSSKNQIVVPKGARRALDLKPGDRLTVVILDNRVVLHKKVEDPVGAFLGSSGGLRYPPDYLDREREAADGSVRLRGGEGLLIALDAGA